MAFIVPVYLNNNIIKKSEDTKFMIVDDECCEIHENDFASVWLFDGRFISGKVTRISYISIEIINEQRVKTYIPYKIISKILKNF